jgi:hypothetical protein
MKTINNIAEHIYETASSFLPNRKMIGEVLIEKGYITPEQLETALAIQKEKGGRLGWILMSLGYISRLQFYEALSEHLYKPFKSLEISDLATDILTLSVDFVNPAQKGQIWPKKRAFCHHYL